MCSVLFESITFVYFLLCRDVLGRRERDHLHGLCGREVLNGRCVLVYRLRGRKVLWM
jgi:hypothetical protein